MCIEALSKALAFFDTRYMFHIIPEPKFDLFKLKLQDVFACQETLDATEQTISFFMPELEQAYTASKTSIWLVTSVLKSVDIEPTDLFVNFKKIDE